MRAASVAGAIALALLALASARASTGDGDPIAFSTCKVQGAKLHVVFANTGVPVVASMHFTLDEPASIRTIRLRGPFATGVRIDRTIAFKGVVPAAVPITCRVRDVHFADGVVWTELHAPSGSQ